MKNNCYFYEEARRLGATHFFYPKGNSHKFILPLNKAAAQAGKSFFLSPSQRMYYGLINLLNFWKNRRRVAIPSDVQEILSFSKKEVELCSIAIGAPGPYQKQTFLRVDTSFSPVTATKLGETPTTHRLLKNEIEKLQWLNRQEIIRNQTPIPYKSSKIKEIFGITESVGVGTKVDIKKNLTEIFAFLHNLHSESNQITAFCKSNIYQSLLKRFVFLKSSLTEKWRKRIEYNLQKIELFSNHKYRFVLAHRDFTKWNMRLTSNGLFVYDWEYAQFGYPPLYDVFHLFLMPKAVNGRLNQHDCWHGFKKIHELNILIEKGDLSMHYQLLLYLMDLCLFYLESNNGRDEEDIVVLQYGRVIDSLKDLPG